METDILHSWNVTPQEAIRIQKRLRSLVRLVPMKAKPALVGGVDVSMMRGDDTAYAGIVVFSHPDLAEKCYALSDEKASMPYIPGLLSFRELPSILKAWDALPEKPDLLLVDGHGIAHPRRLGIAAHLGVLLGVPTVGVAKSVLVGVHDKLGEGKGSRSFLRDKGEWIGTALRTKDGVKPLYVSPGNLVSHDEAADIVLSCVRRHRLPEPTRRAHELVNMFRRGEIE